MEILLEKHYGVDVFVSVQAEAARKAGCLCVRQEDGRTMMCEHLKANIQYEADLKRRFGSDEEGRERLAREIKMRGSIELSAIAHGGKALCWNGECRIALANYAVCISGNVAMAITRCPYYKAASTEQEGT